MPRSADITLAIEPNGTIREATFGVALGQEDPEVWRGARWEHTVTPATRPKIRSLVADARSAGVTGFRQVNHLLPSGVEVPVEYAAVRVDGDGRLVAVGRSLLAVSELQQKLVNTQQALERDYWRLREIETRYRLLFHRSPEAILVVETGSHRLVDVNPAAASLLGIPAGRGKDGTPRVLTDLLVEDDRASLAAMLRRTADTGRGTPLRLHVTHDGAPLEFRPALLSGEENPLVLLHVGAPPRSVTDGRTEIDFGEAVERVPDAMTILDAEGRVVWANRRLLDLVQLRSVGEVVGESLSRWFGRPGADLTILESLVARHGSATLFSTELVGAMGSTTEVEISAAAVGDSPRYMILVLRDVGRRLGEPRPAVAGLARAVEALSDELGRESLKSLVSRTVEMVERQLVSDALELTEGNRTAAAELLGLSRQALYSKLSRYGPEL